jgi:TonB family protein
MNLSHLMARTPIFVGVFFCLAFGLTVNGFGQTTDLDQIASTVSSSLQGEHVGTVIVGDFTEEGDRATLQGVFLADRLWFALLQQQKGLEILNRGLLHKHTYDYMPSRASFTETQLQSARAVGAQVLISGQIKRGAKELTLTIAASRVSAPKEIAKWNWVVPRSSSLDELAVQSIQAKGPVYVLQQDGVSTPACLYCPYPQYSAEARKTKLEGTVVVEAMIDASGRAISVWEVRGLPEGLTQQAVEAVRQWRFKSAQNAAGQPVTAMVPVDVTFRLM